MKKRFTEAQVIGYLKEDPGKGASQGTVSHARLQ